MATAEHLKTELETFAQSRDRLVRESEGKFVVIHGTDVAGVWDTYPDALSAGYQKFGLRPFLVKQIERFEQVHTILGVGACPC